MSLKPGFPFLFSFFSCVVLGLLMGSTALNAQPAQLHTSGNQLLTGTGCAVTLKGVNCSALESYPNGCSGYPSSCEGAGTTVISGYGIVNMVDAVSEAVTAWHANIIRLPLNQDYWMGCSNSRGSPTAAYQGEVQAVVNYCSQNNVYVLLDLHWSGTYASTTSTTPCSGAGWGTATGQQTMPDGNAVTFWSNLAATFANNPAVLFDLYNEPYDPTYAETVAKWDVWKNGGNMGGTPSTSPGLQALLNAIRGAGANNVVVAGGLNWAYDLRGLVGNEPSGGGPVTLTDTASGNGIIYASHVYPSKGASGTFTTTVDGGTYIKPAANTFPVIISEFGNSPSCVSGSNDGGTWINSVTSWISSTNGFVGGVGWDFSPDICPAMLTSWSGYPTNAYEGAPVSEWLATPVPTCPTGPTYTPTNTNTPTHTSTATWTNTITNTFTPTNTKTMTFTPTVTNTPTPTNSPVPTNTPTTTGTPTFTYSPTDTFTTGPTNTFTQTPIYTYTITDTPTLTVTDTPTWTFTSGPANTSTDTPTVAVPTDTNTPGGPANTSTPTPTDTVTAAIPTNTYTPAPPTNTNTPLPAPNTFTPTSTNTAVNTATFTSTFTPTFTPTPAYISQPYPNPVTGPGPVNIDVVIPGQIQWDVFTAAFRKVKGGTPLSGSTNFQWDLTDNSNHPVSNGIYYLRIQVGGYKVVRKILVVR